MRIILTLFSFALSTSILVGQSTVCNLIDKEVKYELISHMQIGEMEYFDDFKDDYKAGFRYRIIVKRIEIQESIFIEKIIVDIEGIPSNISWCKKIDLTALIDAYKINKEQITITNINWRN